MQSYIKSWFKEVSIFNFIIGILLGIVIFSSIYVYCQSFLEPKAFDFLVRLTANHQASNKIVNVVIDDASITAVGRWPWQRRLYSDIFDYLQNYGNAKSIAFDSIITSYGDPKDDKYFFSKLKKLDKVVVGFFFGRQNDFNTNYKSLVKRKYAIKVKDHRTIEQKNATKYYSISNSPVEIVKNLNHMGSVLSRPDKDGVIRKTEPVYLFEDLYFPSLSLAVYNQIKGDNDFQIQKSFLKSNNSSLNIPINTARGTYTFIKWYKPLDKSSLASHKTYSAWKILKSYEQIKKGQKPMLSPDLFKGKIVVVGATASALNDIKITPIGADYPGVDIQATCIDNIINNDFIYKAPMIIRVVSIFFIISVTLFAVMLLQPLQACIVCALLMLSYFHLCTLAFSNNYAVDVVSPQVFIICSLTVGYAYKYFLEGQRKEKIQKAMGKYVSTDVMTSILKNIDNIKPGGERAEITILFSDIRNFTSIAESLEPEKVSEILNEYFSEMIPIITKYNGIINKFVGDALLVVFGAPIPDARHPQNAVFCAIEMLKKVDHLHDKWIKEDKPKLEIGVGINTGVAFVGNIGSEERLEYTVIGDTVNVASRIEAYNKLYGTRLLISESTYGRVQKNIKDVIKITSVPIKGKVENIDIYEIIEFDEQSIF